MKQRILKQLKLKNLFSALFSVAVGAVIISPSSVRAIEDPPNCALADGGAGNTSQGGINFVLIQAHINDTVSVFPSLGMAPNACNAVNATGTVYIATGPLTNFLINVTLPSSTLISCPSGVSCQPGPYSFQITPALVGAGVTSPNGSTPGLAKTVRAVENGFGTVETGTPEEQLADFHTASLTIVTPCIDVVKLCSYPQGQSSFQPGQNIAFTGYVTNCGDIELTNVFVQDSRTSTLLDSNGIPLLQPLTLLVGQAIPFHGTYAPTLQETCSGSATNTVTVSGQDTTTIGGPNSMVTNFTSVACSITVIPCLTVTKTCATVIAGQPQLISGVVSNCGNIAITNITITDNIAGPITNISVLPPGTSSNYSLTITAACGTNFDYVTASGFTLCGSPISNSATNFCVGTESPCITVMKTCTTAVVGQPQTISGVVTNCGNVPLTNIVVADNVVGGITNVSSLAPGAFFFYSKTVTATCGGNTNVVTASGSSVPCGTLVAAKATNTCVTTESPCISVTSACTSAVVGSTQTISGTVTNCGNDILSNIVVSDSLLGGITNFTTLAPGAGFGFSATLTAVCGGNTNIITASALSQCGTPISAMSTNTCVTTESPCLGVTSACSTAVVGGTQIITGTVTNCGNDILTNIVVTDSLLGSVTNFAALAPGGSFTYTNTLTAVCGGSSNVVTASAISQCGTPVSASSTNVCITTESPCITVTKTCTTAVVGQPQTISGAVTNCGNVALTNISVSDNIAGSITNVTLLPPGGFFFYNKTVTATCGGNTNIVTASAISQCGTPVSAMATNVCITTESPCITVAGSCSSSVVGGLQFINGAVTNCGNVTLTNITLTDSLIGSLTNVSSLAPGEFFTFTNAITAICGGKTNIVTAAGVSICGTVVSAKETNVCVATESPCITVTKTCTTAVVGQPQTISGAVTNCGNDILTNITVVDNVVGSITNVSTLAPGGFFFYSKTVTAICGGNTNVVTASALSQCGTPVAAMATNTCVTTESPCITLTGACSVAAFGQLQFITGAVTNCGDDTLTNIVVSDTVVGTITNLASLPPGGFFLYTNALTAVCGGNTNVVTASAISICGTPVSASVTNTCVVTESPCITVTKTCTTAVVGQPQTISGAVTNCGNVTLTNISVADNIIGSITNGVTLRPGSFFFYDKTVTAVCGGNTNIVTAAGVSICGTPVSAMATNTCVVTESPCITVTKTCTTAVVGQPQTISGAVTNCGNDILTNITVVDNVVGSITNVSTLAPGGFFFYSKTVTAICGGNTNIVTASAISQCGTPVSAMATNTCVTTESPCIKVVGSCSSAVVGGLQFIGGSVTNCGNVTLTNVTVTDNLIDTITNVPLLAPGGSFVFTNAITAVCGGNTNIVTASGVSICGTPVSTEETNVCVATESPCITITKNCTTAVVGQPQTVSGAVTNCGNVTLTNISVTDSVIGSITNGVTLTPGSFFFYSKTVTALCGGNTNIVTAAGVSICGTPVSAEATNTCVTTESPCIGVTGNCSTGICATGVMQIIGGVVTNCGNVTLTNVILTDSLVGSFTNVPFLPPGGSFLFTNELTTICGGTTNIVTASAVSVCGTPVSSAETNVCPAAEIPCLTVSKNCTTAVAGQPQTISGAVTNCGNVTLVDISVVDDVIGNITNGITLFPGTFLLYSKTVTAVCGGNTDIVTAAGVSTCGTPVSARATNTCFTTESPCIIVVGSCSTGRSCSCPTAVDVQLIGGAVTNCGNVTLTNVTVTDSFIGTLTNVHLLPPGGSFVFTNKISTLCGGNMNIVTASAVSICGTPVSAMETNMCATTETPCITVTKDCSEVTCSNTTVSGTVLNCGNVTLTNIIVTDNLFGTITNISSLAPNSSIAFSISAMVTNSDMNADFVAAVGTTICGTPVGDTATNNCVLQLPGVGITKQVACFLGANDQGSETCGVFSNSVVAISSDTQKPAFCYSITITNPGPLDLEDVSIVDTNPAAGMGFGDLTAEFPCVTPVFPIGASCTYTFKAQLASDLTNIVSITGFSPSGQSVEAEASAVATVYPASISCLKQYTIDGGPLTNNANLPDQNPHTIVWYATVSNPSTNVNLADVILTDVTTNLACSIALPPFSLDAGSNILIALCTNVLTATSDSFAITNTINVTADEFSLGTNHLPVCAHDITGSNIVVSSECQALLTAGSAPGCPPVANSIVSKFNTTSINTTNDLWFNANFHAKDVPASGATVFLNNAQLTINSKNGQFSYIVPNAEIIFSPSATCATTLFDGTQWVTTVPVSGSDEILLTALGIKAPANVKAATVTFNGAFSANTTGISLIWKWSAAVYKTDMTQPQYNNLGVKPTHTKACPYSNTDQAGTPENMKRHLAGGAKGGGGRNFTGSWSATGSVTLCPLD